MQAAVITSFGDPHVLEIKTREIPKPQEGEVLIAVYAAGINRPDLFQRKGKYPAPKGIVQDVPGLEVAGQIMEVGEGVDKSKIGTNVMALVAGGGYAEYVVAPSVVCIPKPANLSFVEAASLPETLFTTYYNIFQRGNLKANDRILIHGGSGGIGSTAIQLAAIHGATVYTTVGSQEKGEYTLNLGAHLYINYKTQDFEAELKDSGINLILDSIGGSYFPKNIAILAEDGRLIYINATQGPKVELNLVTMMQKRILLTGSTLRSRSIEFKGKLARSLQNHVIPLLENGTFKPIVFRTFQLQEVVAAHQLMENGDFMGKIVLGLRAE